MVKTAGILGTRLAGKSYTFDFDRSASLSPDRTNQIRVSPLTPESPVASSMEEMKINPVYAPNTEFTWDRRFHTSLMSYEHQDMHQLSRSLSCSQSPRKSKKRQKHQQALRLSPTLILSASPKSRQPGNKATRGQTLRDRPTSS